MMIQRISPNSAANHLYIFNNYNYNNNRSMAVTPVKPIKKLSPFEEERYKYAALYQNEKQEENAVKSIETKRINEIKEEYTLAENVSYNMDNIYERERMSAEVSVFLGMNFDIFA